jgi:hypothetical protein
LALQELNASLGGYNYSALEKQTICDYNGLFVAAAGNDGNDNDIKPHYPSGYNCPNIIEVASTNRNDNLSSFSNYGANSTHPIA